MIDKLEILISAYQWHLIALIGVLAALWWADTTNDRIEERNV